MVTVLLVSFVFGQWMPLGPGGGWNTEFLTIHPQDANIAIGTNDACGVVGTGDGGRTWSYLNRGLNGGTYVNGTLVKYNNGPLNCPIWFDPVDPNYVWGGGLRMVFGKMERSDGKLDVKWTYLPGLQPRGWNVWSCVFDPVPDPNGTGTAKIFYTVEKTGNVAYTNDGGGTFRYIATVPGYDKANLWNYPEPLLAVLRSDPADRTGTLLACPSPSSRMLVLAYHDQTDPNAVVAWQPDDPELVDGLPTNDPNAGATSIRVLQDATGLSVVLSAKPAYGYGGIFTRRYEDWTPTGPWEQRWNQGQDRFTFGMVSFSPLDPNIAYTVKGMGSYIIEPHGVLGATNLFAADPNQTVWKKMTDPNISWHPNGNLECGLTYGPPHANWWVHVAPSDANVLYYQPDYISGVMKSVNAGKTWEQVTTNKIGTERWRSGNRYKTRGLCAIHTQCVALAPSDPNIIWMGGSDATGHYKSTDGGDTWSLFFNLQGRNGLNTEPTSDRFFMEFPLDPNKPLSPDNVWREMEANLPSYCRAGFEEPFWLATDKEWWIPPGLQPDMQAAVVHPTDPNIAWFAFFDFVLYNDPREFTGIICKTTDGGRTLTIIWPDARRFGNWSKGTTKIRPYDMTADPNLETFYLANGEAGVWRSTEQGHRWTRCFDPNDPNFDPNPTTRDPNDRRFVALDVCRDDPNVVYCVAGKKDTYRTNDRGFIFKTTDKGASWRRLTGDPFTSKPRMNSDVAIHPNDPNIVYVGCYDWPSDPNNGGGVWRTTDGGATWKRLFPSGSMTALVRHVFLHPQDPNYVYCTVQEHNYSPTQGVAPGLWAKVGDEWVRDPVSADISNRYYSASVHPVTAQLYLGTPNGVLRRPLNHNLNITLEGSGEVVRTPDAPRFPFASKVKLEAKPASGKAFSGWKGLDNDPNILDANNPVVVTMDRDRDVTAVFMCGSSSGGPAVVVLGSLLWMLFLKGMERARLRRINAQQKNRFG